MVEWGMLLAPMLAAAVAAGPVCQVDDKRLDEISGLVATSDGYVVVNDSADEASHRKIFYLKRDCSLKRTVNYPSRPRDTEDLQLGRDGTLWVADIGDNGENRDTIALWKLAPGSSKPKLFRLSYPDGAHDAEALLLAADGSPIVVTKTPGAAGVYVADGALRSGGTTPLRAAGSVTVPMTTTSNPFSLPGHLVITGAASSPDGSRVVLRTYADAFEYDVAGGDVVKAITTGTPRQIALPDEPQGESVAYSADGTALLTISEGAKPVLFRHALPSAPAASSPAPSPSPSAAGEPLAAMKTAEDEPNRLPILLVVLAGTAAILAAAVLVHRRTRRR
ncbi:hypothetical protein BJY16_006879 [Actinoplanes octamycinicus]|uniref:WD40 repeat protein n=1 Tax=Actinoplanes octamycinicus TaxID=135948 RepID=A0A7W7H3N6_9ACTN|nr:hypothetical protein [Actinoplanes octamycinicus]MBB4743420.1 hypothetical protein [Actinoplanes octamycinicus]GIE63416.1 hypothetical protein Aoc01nite_88180 [Actinoplanes octamycinicus]